MELVNFEITDMEAGWFCARLSADGQMAELSHSYLGGGQIPGLFLSALCGLLEGTKGKTWLCWEAEGMTYLWHLCTEGDDLHLQVYGGTGSFRLPPEGTDMESYVDGAALVDVHTSLYLFASDVMEAFQTFNTEQGWADFVDPDFPFPEKAYKALRKILKG